MPRAGLSWYASRIALETFRSEVSSAASRTSRCPWGVIVSSCILRQLAVLGMVVMTSPELVHKSIRYYCINGSKQERRLR